ncbi:integral peroxisomal membrane peroxin-domain-containing protein [Dendryphion nanum]|uniref:Integral peroxisomal membrane peroxin-domain-containing protein n=1 Tax=Dendryphion nanum TaxID=256645 RepID=A0A9P9E676_9PLEO|nr:integral peroxisomal membrane peroxin-domain-containing protein [Dendryphion nanum]
MSNGGSQPVANRDAPIPVVSITSPDDNSADRTPSNQDGSKHRLSATKLKDKLESLGDNIGKSESPSRVSDRVFTMLLQQILPAQDYPDDAPTVKDRRSRAYVDRPSFSIPTMSSNFRRFNSRIGVAFVFQNRLIRLFTWRQPSQTLSFLATYTFICLNPPLLIVLPLASCLFFVMVPAFLVRHPPPPTSLPTDLYALNGPPLAAAQTIKPAPELSKDFFRNMRDLQNCMEDFSRAHDAILAFITPLTNFSNEALSSTVYLLLLFTSCLLFITAHLLPFRFLLLVAGYVAVLLGHPAVQDLISTPENAAFLQEKEHESRSMLLNLSKSDIELATAPETREVEIFELQHRALHDEDGEYEPYIFSPSPYSPLSPSRIAGDRPKGTAFFEDVQPPRGWRWSDKKWTLDLLSQEWVEERCVTGVEVEIEGERWVTDLHYEVLSAEEDNGSALNRRKGKNGRDSEREVLKRVWESRQPSRKGEWRRRRWVRGVDRMPLIQNWE